MGIFGLFGGSAQKQLFNFDSDIPYDVFRLLWFGDGIYKNIQNITKILTLTSEYASYSTEVDNGKEPSIIYTTLPTKPIIKKLSMPDQFLSYQYLEPDQRLNYLLWLKDISKPIDEYCLWLFISSLERHLMIGNIEEAVDFLITLWKSHKNRSITADLFKKLLSCLLLHQKKEKIVQILDQYPFEIMDSSLSLYLYTKHVMNHPFTCEEIIALAPIANFSDNPTIQKHRDLFKVVLHDELICLYKEPYLRISHIPLEKLKRETVSFLSNPSFSNPFQSMVIPDLVASQDMCTLLKKTLYLVQEITKTRLK